MPRRGYVVAASLSAALSAGCFSPVEDDLISELGPEIDGLEEGQYHRYGQPCLVCHGGYKAPLFSAAGTVFTTPTDDIPVAGVVVKLTDANGDVYQAPTNCAGNFFITGSEWDPVFPLRAEIECTLPDGTKRRSVMQTRINRDGGCGSCHEPGPANQFSPGQVYCMPEQPSEPFTVPESCPGGPNGVGGE
jgi:hypothetical protein